MAMASSRATYLATLEYDTETASNRSPPIPYPLEMLQHVIIIIINIIIIIIRRSGINPIPPTVIDRD